MFTPSGLQADPESNSVATITIASGNTGSVFEMLGPNLVTHSVNTLDYETTGFYTILLDIEDDGTPVLTSTVTVYVTVRNECLGGTSLISAVP